MVWLLLVLPWVLRGVGVISALVGLFQGQQVLSGGYGASPWNLGSIAVWLSTAVGTWVASFLAQPTTWATLKAALDKVFQWVKTRAKVLWPTARSDSPCELPASFDEPVPVLALALGRGQRAAVDHRLGRGLLREHGVDDLGRACRLDATGMLGEVEPELP